MAILVTLAQGYDNLGLGFMCTHVTELRDTAIKGLCL